MKKIVISIFLLIIIFTAMWAIANRKHLLSFPDIISSFYAKEFCSCYYVSKRSAEDCHQTVRQFIDISDFTNDTQKKIVTASGLGQSNQARYIGERYGCQLVNKAK